jgi:hypothetical protein
VKQEKWNIALQDFIIDYTFTVSIHFVMEIITQVLPRQTYNIDTRYGLFLILTVEFIVPCTNTRSDYFCQYK